MYGYNGIHVHIWTSSETFRAAGSAITAIQMQGFSNEFSHSFEFRCFSLLVRGVRGRIGGNFISVGFRKEEIGSECGGGRGGEGCRDDVFREAASMQEVDKGEGEEETCC